MPETNYIILTTNLSKSIAKDILFRYPINSVVSFDYSKVSDETLANGKNFFSVLSWKNQYANLRLSMKNNKIKEVWTEKPFDY